MIFRPNIALNPRSLSAGRPTLASRVSLHLRRPLALLESEAMFEVRGFSSAGPQPRARLEEAGATFIRGYNAALLSDDLAAPRRLVDATRPEFAGFAAEGAAMGAAIADAFSLRATRLEAWLSFANDRFTYLAHVGVGWALTRVPWRKRAILRQLDAVHFWLAHDGRGFAESFFDSATILRGARGTGAGYELRAYDQGVGRALWFIFGGDADRAARWISTMLAERQPDLWSGLGLALAYAGGAAPEAVERLAQQAAANRAFLAQGIAFAAEAHTRAGSMPEHCQEAARMVARRDAAELVLLVRRQRAAAEAEAEREVPRYELWRRAVQGELRGASPS